MSLFAVTRQAGPAWIDGAGALEQPDVADHAAFMDRLAAEGLILSGGPLAGTEAGRVRVLLIADAASEGAVRQRLTDDPWEIADRISTVAVEPWTLFVGADRLPSR